PGNLVYPNGSVQRLLKGMNWRSWKPYFVQALSCEDCDIRMEFAESPLAWIQEEPNLLRHILWSDERSVINRLNSTTLIKMDLREVGYDGRDWINLAQDRGRWRAYVRAAMNLRVP
ncbi:hypothetical protein ANN_14407, partial [Periplaneta americana]